MIVELRAVPGCPNLPATRELLRTCLAEAGLPPYVVELLGEYRSPSILIDGHDVTGADPGGPAACVLAPPTVEQIRDGLRRAMSAASPVPPASPSATLPESAAVNVPPRTAG